MKSQLKFDLDNFDDKMSHYRCVKSLDMALALFDIMKVRRAVEDLEEEGREEEIFKRISDIFDDYDINLDKLVC